MIKKLMNQYGLSQAQATHIVDEVQSQTIKDIEANGWRIVPTRPTFRALRMAYGYFDESPWHYAKIWAVMVRMMPSYQGHSLPETSDTYHDIEKSQAIDKEYAALLARNSGNG